MNEITLEALKELKNKLEINGVVCKKDILSLEEHCDTNVFSSSGVCKYLTELPSATGLVEVKKIIDGQLNNHTVSGKELYSYDELINQIRYIDRTLYNLKDMLSELELNIDKEKYAELVNDKITLAYTTDGRLYNIAKEETIIDCFNSCDYVEKLLKILHTDDDEIQKKLEIHAELLNRLLRQKDQYNTFPFLNLLLQLTNNSAETDYTVSMLKCGIVEQITFETLLELFFNLKRSIRNIDTILDHHNRIFGINSDYALEKIDLLLANDIYNIISGGVKQSVSDLFNITLADSVVLLCLVNILTSNEFYTEFYNKYTELKKVID